MGQLSVNRSLEIALGCGEWKWPHKAKAAETFYKGEHVSIDSSGWLVKATDTSGEHYMGIVAEPSAAVAGESSGDREVVVIHEPLVLLPCVSITQAMVGDVLEIVDSTNVDDSGGTSNHVKVGQLVEYVSTTSGWVKLLRATA
ncbi:MAG: hypothetical protein AMJ46_14180 [Latescibacteria bacterium DG_63]|nr:MAG: hypothetical protein AMJ46_14180 [Latescibacteria bacterium DG_63]